MNCPDHETLSAFFDGEAPEAGEHVATCDGCRAFLADLTTIREAIVAARPVSPGVGRRASGAGERSASAIGVSVPTPHSRLPMLAFALLALVLLAVPALLLLRSRERK